MTQRTDEDTKIAIAKCIGRAVAPYAFKRGKYSANDEKYAKDVPFTNIETEAETILRLFPLPTTSGDEELVEEFKQRIGYEKVGSQPVLPKENSDVIVGAFMMAIATKNQQITAAKAEERAHISKALGELDGRWYAIADKEQAWIGGYQKALKHARDVVKDEDGRVPPCPDCGLRASPHICLTNQ